MNGQDQSIEFEVRPLAQSSPRYRGFEQLERKARRKRCDQAFDSLTLAVGLALTSR